MTEKYNLPGFLKHSLILTIVLLCSLGANATTYYSRVSGNWNALATWSLSIGGGAAPAFPGAGDDVVIIGGFTVTVNVSSACATISIKENSTLSINRAITVSGTTTIGDGTTIGSLVFTSITGTKSFNGLVTVNNGASWNNSLLSSPVTFKGGITLNGTGSFSAGSGLHTFNVNPQILTGNFSFSDVTVVNAGVVLTNSNTLTISGTLAVSTASASVLNNGTLSVVNVSGSGKISQGTSSSMLTISGTTSSTGSLDATVSGNAVNYSGASQTIYSGSYYDLLLSGSGNDVLQATTTTINRDLTMSGSVSTTALAALAITRHLTIGSGCTFIGGTFSHTIGGNWINDGIFTNGGGTITLNGAGQTISGGATPYNFNNLTLSGSGTKTFGVAVAISGTLALSSGVVADLGSFTHAANALTLGGGIRPSGNWGGTGTTAPATVYTDATYFAPVSTGWVAVATGAYTYYSFASGNWSTAGTWSTVGFSGPAETVNTPTTSDYVIIGNSKSVNVDVSATVATLSFYAGTSETNQLTINSGQMLTVSGAVTIPRTVTSGSNTLTAAGNLVAQSSLNFTNSGASGASQLDISGGTATITVDVTSSGAGASIIFSGGGGTLSFGGSLYSAATGSLTTIANSTVVYSGTAQTIQTFNYQNLTLSGSGDKMAAGNSTINGDLIVHDNTNFKVGAFTLAVGGATTIGDGSSGTLTINAATGTKTFTGLVTINSGATWSNTAGESVTIQGGISRSNTGTTFTAGTGTYTFNTNSPQTLTGDFTFQNVTVAGGGVQLINTNSLTVQGTLTISSGSGSVLNNGTLSVVNVSGSGKISQGTSSSMLTISGTTSSTGSLDATVSGNAVNYSGASQTIYSGSYYDLLLSGSGNDVLQATTTTINRDFTLSGSVSTTALAALAITRHLTIGSGCTFIGGTFSHTIGGNWINDGIFTNGGGTITLNGAGQTISGGATPYNFNNLTLSGSGTKTFGVAVAISGTLALSSGVVADLGSFTHAANALTLGGGIRPSGNWGGTGTTAPATVYTDATYFAPVSTGWVAVATGAYTYYSFASGNWSTAGTWSTVGFSGPAETVNTPTTSDYVIIGNSKSVNVDVSATVATLSFYAGTSETNQLTINSGQMLTVSGAVTIPRTVTSGSNTLTAAGNLVAQSSLNFTNSGASGASQLDISGGTATITVDVTSSGAGASIIFSGGGGTLSFGGSLYSAATGSLTTIANSTVVYSGTAQTIQTFNYQNLTFSGSGDKTAAGNSTINGDLIVHDNTNFKVGAFTLAVGGATTIGDGSSGTLTINAATGTKTFTGLVTINSGATWSNTAGESVTIQGGISRSNTGTTFTAGTGTYTFNTNSPQTLTGDFTFQNVTVAGGGVQLINTNSLTVQGTLTISSGSGSVLNNGTLSVVNVSGSGKISQGTSSPTLTISGTTSATGSLDATVSGNTVNYSGASQTIYSGSYYDLLLSGSGNDVLQATTTTINRDFTLSGSVSTTALAALAITRHLTIGSGCTFIGGTFSHTIGGNWINDGIFTHSNGTITFNGGNQSIGGLSAINNFYDLQLTGTLTKTFSKQAKIDNNLSITGSKADWDGLVSHTANALILNGIVQSVGGTWGSVASNATNPTDTYFINSGWIDIATGIQTYYLFANNKNWNDPNTWSTTGFSGPSVSGAPSSADYVRIGGNKTVTVNAPAVCASLSFDAGTSVTNQLTVNSTLAVSGDINIPQTVTSGSNILSIGTGTLTVTNINFTNGSAGGTGHIMNFATGTTGTATVSGNITSTGTSSSIVFNGAGLMQVAGTIYAPSNGSITAGTGTIEYNGTTQTIQTYSYKNLIVSGSGTKTFAVATTTISGDLSVIKGATLNVGGLTLNVNGTTTIGATVGPSSGTVVFVTSAAGNKTFRGAVTINSLGTWNNAINESPFFRAGITNNAVVGNFIAGTGNYTFNTTSGAQLLAGTLSIPTVTVTSPTVLTNNGTLTIGTALSGTGGFTQGSSSTLKLGGTSTIANITASAPGNTVNFNGSVQAVTGAINFYNLNINSSVSFKAPSGIMGIAGDFTNNSPSFLHNNGKVLFSGTSLQSVQGSGVTTFNNINVSNSTPGVSVRLESNQNLFGTLTLSSGSTFDADGSSNNSVFTLLSSADKPTQDASIASIPSTASVIGSVTVQRYFGIADDVDRFISSPVSGATVAQLQQAFPITGNFTGTSYPCTGCTSNNASFKWYNETLSGALTNGYTVYPSSGGSNASTLVPGVGYEMWMWNGVASSTVNFRGPINQGAIAIKNQLGSALSYTKIGAGTASADGWNLIGNPYPSAIQWNNGTGWSKGSNIDPTVWVWDVVGNVWHSYNATTTIGDLTNGVISSGQAFWVYVSGASSGLSITEDAKSTAGNGSYYRKEAPDIESLVVSLNQGEVSENSYVIPKSQISGNAFNSVKPIMGDERLSIAIMENNNKYGHYALSEAQESIPLFVHGKTEGEYSISFELKEGSTVFDGFYLVDLESKVSTKVLSDNKYTFNLTANEHFNAESRFVLTKKPDLILSELGVEEIVKCYPNPTTEYLTIEINSEDVKEFVLLTNSGDVVAPITFNYSGTVTKAKVNMEVLPSGLYLIKGLVNGKVVVEKIVKYK